LGEGESEGEGPRIGEEKTFPPNEKVKVFGEGIDGDCVASGACGGVDGGEEVIVEGKKANGEGEGGGAEGKVGGNEDGF